jgi:predicted amidohydrolase YtcJ
MVESNSPPADLALIGGRVLTVNSQDEVVDAVAVVGNKIAAVGSRQEVERLISPETRVFDLRGRTALPGFVENHIHMTNAPRRAWLNVGTQQVGSIPELCERVAERTTKVPKGGWVWAYGYHPERLTEGRHPTRHDLDTVSPDHPVGIVHREGMGWTFNTLGLRKIGVQNETQDPPGGPMQRDHNGHPEGPMFDNTRAVFVRPNLPKPTESGLIEDYRWMCQELNRYGITSAYEAAIRSAPEVQAWHRLKEEGGLSLRVNLGPYPLEGSNWTADGVGTKMYDAGLYTTFGDEWIKIGALTYGVDGGVFGQTAALFEPYSNDPNGQYRGSFRVSQEVAASFSTSAHTNGWQISAVCHGDHGVTVAVDAIEKAQRARPGQELRHRLEHAYLWDAALFERISDQNIVWNTQPSIVAALGRWGTLDAWGPRVRHAFPVRSALEHGIVVSGGSDWSVTHFDPMVGIHFLTTRRLEPLADGLVLNPDEAVSMLEAVRIYTYNGAYTAFEENIKGSLEVGKLADITVLSDDLLSVPPDAIRDIQVVMTILDGKIVHEA